MNKAEKSKHQRRAEARKERGVQGEEKSTRRLSIYKEIDKVRKTMGAGLHELLTNLVLEKQERMKKVGELEIEMKKKITNLDNKLGLTIEEIYEDIARLSTRIVEEIVKSNKMHFYIKLQSVCWLLLSAYLILKEVL